MQRRWLAVALVGLAVLFEASAKSQRWVVDFEVQALDRVLVPRALGAAQPDWYCTYAVTNNTGMDRDLALSLFVETDVARGAPGRRRLDRHADVVDPIVQRTVETRLGRDRDRHYLDSVQVQGRLRAAERKEGIAVFGPVSTEADTMTLYVVGLSSAVEEKRRGMDYVKMIQGGKEVCTVERDPDRGCEKFVPLARRIDVTTYKRMISEEGGGKTIVRKAVTEAEGEVCYALDAPILTAAEPASYLERMVLRRRYSRDGDESRPQTDVYRCDGEDWILVIKPLAPPGASKP